MIVSPVLYDCLSNVQVTLEVSVMLVPPAGGETIGSADTGTSLRTGAGRNRFNSQDQTDMLTSKNDRFRVGVY